MSISSLKREVGKKAADLLLDISGNSDYPVMIAEIRAQFGVGSEVIHGYLARESLSRLTPPPDEDDDDQSLLEDYYEDEED